MMLICDVSSVVIEYDRRRSGFSNALLDMEYGNNNIEQ